MTAWWELDTPRLSDLVRTSSPLIYNFKSLFRYIFFSGTKKIYICISFFNFRYETRPLCTGGWEEHQCWGSQTRPGSGVGCMRICSAFSKEDEKYQLNLTLRLKIFLRGEAKTKKKPSSLEQCSKSKLSHQPPFLLL